MNRRALPLAIEGAVAMRRCRPARVRVAEVAR